MGLSLVRGKAAHSAKVLLSAIQAVVRNNLCRVKNGPDYCAPGSPAKACVGFAFRPARERLEQRVAYKY